MAAWETLMSFPNVTFSTMTYCISPPIIELNKAKNNKIKGLEIVTVPTKHEANN
jgi:hypothetical protein